VNTSKRRLALAGVLSLSLLAAACGSDDDAATTTESPAAEATLAPVGDTEAPAADGTDAPAADGTDAPAVDSTAPAEPAGDPMDFSTLQGELVASGATFPKGFYDESIAELAGIAPDLVVEYGGGGSGKGRSDLQEQVVDFAGTDSTVKDEDMPLFKGGEFVYVPTVIAPITMSYNLPDVESLQLSPEVIAGIFQLTITNWNDPAIAADNPDATLPDTDIVVVRRADGSGTTDNFSKFLDAAVGADSGGIWTLGTGSELEWPDGTQGGDGNSGVAQIITATEGAIGYVDLSDAVANGLSFASVKNKAGNFIEPTLEATTAAAENATINDDLTFFLGWADGDDSYPIAAQTWIIAYTTQDDPATAEAIRGFLTYLLTDGQELASSLDYAPLPADLAERALANVQMIGA
jgi:phosphate transport system substrate-binding protein